MCNKAGAIVMILSSSWMHACFIVSLLCSVRMYWEEASGNIKLRCQSSCSSTTPPPLSGFPSNGGESEIERGNYYFVTCGWELGALLGVN